MSANPNIFDSVRIKVPPQNVFDLTHSVATSGKMGLMIPIMAQDTLPGSIFNISSEAMIRFMPTIAPVMQRYDCIIDHWFVPNRILVSDEESWQNFIVNKKDPGGNLHVAPTINVSAATYTKLHDYMGIPTPIGPNVEKVLAYPFAAYQKIWNDNYRDENLQAEIDYLLNEGDNTVGKPGLSQIRRVAWEHDYLTSCLPFAQKGDPVFIPMTFQDVPVLRNISNEDTTPPQLATQLNSVNITDPLSLFIVNQLADNPNDDVGEQQLYAATSTLQGVATINDLREAEAIQKWFELLARVGDRYKEWLATWGVRGKDARLEQPEYIGGVKSNVVISEVLNTTGQIDGEGQPQGTMAGHGISVLDGYNRKYRCDDYGWIISVLFIRPKTTYFQGLHRKFTRFDATDYYNHMLANLGEQAVKNKEVYAFQGEGGELTFGYNPRYQEYRFINNIVTGQLKTTLSYWTHARVFPDAPNLNDEFIQCEPSDDIFAVVSAPPDDDNLVIMVIHKIKAILPVAKHGIPSLT